jgi:hypothetical protein
MAFELVGDTGIEPVTSSVSGISSMVVASRLHRHFRSSKIHTMLVADAADFAQ